MATCRLTCSLAVERGTFMAPWPFRKDPGIHWTEIPLPRKPGSDAPTSEHAGQDVAAIAYIPYRQRYTPAAGEEVSDVTRGGLPFLLATGNQPPRKVFPDLGKLVDYSKTKEYRAIIALRGARLHCDATGRPVEASVQFGNVVGFTPIHISSVRGIRRVVPRGSRVDRWLTIHSEGVPRVTGGEAASQPTLTPVEGGVLIHYRQFFKIAGWLDRLQQFFPGGPPVPSAWTEIQYRLSPATPSPDPGAPGVGDPAGGSYFWGSVVPSHWYYASQGVALERVRCVSMVPQMGAKLDRFIQAKHCHPAPDGIMCTPDGGCGARWQASPTAGDDCHCRPDEE